MKRFIGACLLCGLSAFAAIGEETDAAARLRAGRLETIKYGTEAELGNLIAAVKSEKDGSLDAELVALLQESESTKIIDGVFSYLSDETKSGGEKKALELLENRDRYANSNVDSAIRYASVLRLKKASSALRDILEAEESRFQAAAARALGPCGEEADVDFLLDLIENADPPDAVAAEIVFALGEIRSRKASAYLKSLLESEDSKAARKMAALESLGKIADPDALDAVLAALRSDDANVRAYAMAALGSYEGKKVESAVLAGFRDSYYKVRIASAKAAGERKLGDAVPFLKYRAERDEVVAAREESIAALGAIGNDAAAETLAALFAEKKSADRLRAAAARALLSIKSDRYGKDVIAAMETAKNEKKTPLYHALAKTLSETKTPAFTELARAFLASNDIIDKHYGLDLVILNGYGSLRELVEPLAKDANASLARKAQAALER